MQMRRILLVSIVCFAIAVAELQGPPVDSSANEKKESSESTAQKSSNNERKSSAESNDNVVVEVDDTDGSIDENSLASLLAEEFALQGSAIKIIKSPDLSQDNEAQKVTEMLTTLVNSHAKLIKKLEDEIDEIDGSLASLKSAEEPEPVLTPEQIELENLYEAAMKILNKTRSDKAGGFAMLKQAADKGHLNAQAKIAWAQLMGNPIEMNFEEAKNTFLKLADTGLPDAHMVSVKSIRLRCSPLSRVIIQKLIYFSLVGIGIHVCSRNWIQCESSKSIDTLHVCRTRR